jgi:hypothetical protein
VLVLVLVLVLAQTLAHALRQSQSGIVQLQMGQSLSQTVAKNTPIRRGLLPCLRIAGKAVQR